MRYPKTSRTSSKMPQTVISWCKCYPCRSIVINRRSLFTSQKTGKVRYSSGALRNVCVCESERKTFKTKRKRTGSVPTHSFMKRCRLRLLDSSWIGSYFPISDFGGNTNFPTFSEPYSFKRRLRRRKNSLYRRHVTILEQVSPILTRDTILYSTNPFRGGSCPLTLSTSILTSFFEIGKDICRSFDTSNFQKTFQCCRHMKHEKRETVENSKNVLPHFFFFGIKH